MFLFSFCSLEAYLAKIHLLFNLHPFIFERLNMIFTLMNYATLRFMIWVGVRRRPSSFVHCALTSQSQELLVQSYPHLLCCICTIRRQNFMTPTQMGGGFVVKSVKLMYFWKKYFLLYPQA